jgi:hypothetical protein
MVKEQKVPDAWDDDWEAQADVSIRGRTIGKLLVT